jgi:hydrogenase maturation protease
MRTPRILVAGIGNIFLGDDAFGVEVVRRLAQRPLPENVRVVDFGIRGFDLAYALMDGYDTTILVDAVPRGGAPGTLYAIEPDIHQLESESLAVETHGMNPMRVLAMVKTMGGELGSIVLVGCEPEDLGEGEDGRLGLSDAVGSAVDEAVAMVESLIWNQTRQTDKETRDRETRRGVED